MQSQTNFALRVPTTAWWLHLRPLLRVLAKYGFEDDESDGGGDANQAVGADGGALVEPMSRVHFGIGD